MQGPSDEEIKDQIVFNLHWKRCWGGKHTALESVKKGIKPHLAGRYLSMAKELIREGLIVPKPTSYGLHISLNTNRKDEILERAERFAKK